MKEDQEKLFKDRHALVIRRTGFSILGSSGTIVMRWIHYISTALWLDVFNETSPNSQITPYLWYIPFVIMS